MCTEPLVVLHPTIFLQKLHYTRLHDSRSIGDIVLGEANFYSEPPSQNSRP